jgi:crotonobetainyl-CoA:carnitine CoA-transferase CaiB-like acyl-CoA transferase
MTNPQTPGPLPRHDAAHLPGMLAGIRVIEVADETGEYVGLTLAGLGADVVKVEAPSGSPTRHIGPFLNDEPGDERSLHFWNYNRGKRSVMLDLQTPSGIVDFRRLLASADILLDASSGAVARALGVQPGAIAGLFPGLITTRITPFGDVGPWKDHKASDLVHLALGGIMMNCGYDPDPARHYDMPPIAPQLWHAYHIAGQSRSLHQQLAKDSGRLGRHDQLLVRQRHFGSKVLLDVGKLQPYDKRFVRKGRQFEILKD